MQGSFHHLRLLFVALAAMWTMALNHQQVVVARVLPAAKTGKSAVTPRKNVVVVRERVSLESTHADAFSVAGPVVAWLPVEPTRAEIAAYCRAPFARILLQAAPRLAQNTTVGLVARLVGSSLSPQAP
jgi:hypothetical protein